MAQGSMTGLATSEARMATVAVNALVVSACARSAKDKLRSMIF